MSGKWHVGGDSLATEPPETGSRRRPDHPTPWTAASTRYYGMLGGGGSYFNPPPLWQNDPIMTPRAT